MKLLTAERFVTAQGMAGNTVLIDGGKIAALGIAGRDFDQQPGNHAEVLSFPGATIVPGLGDAHFHPLGYTAAVTRLSLKTTRDLADLADRLQAAAGRLRPGVPLIGQRLDDEALAERRLPDRHDLDRALADRPVVLYRYCGHVAVANTAALEAAAIVPGTVDPAGGGIDRDQSGVPNGILRETAVRLVAQALGGRTEGLDPADLLRAMSTLAALGLTRLGAIVSAGDPIWCGVGDELTSLIEVGPDLPFPVDVLVIADDEAMLESAARRLSDASPRLSFLGWKDFADGSLGGHTAALHTAYSDLPSERGTLRLDPAHARRMAKATLGLGGMVALHAIGDRANDEVIDLFEELVANGAEPARLRIEHASVLSERAVDRLGRLGVVVSIQPAFLASEGGWLPKRIDPERLRWTYPFRSLLEAGVRLAGGSDCPVEPPDPLWGMTAACRRGGLTPSESLTGAQALGLFTDGVAAGGGRPLPTQVGQPANFTVLGADPTDHPAPHRIEMLATVIDGVVFRGEPEFEWPG